MTRGQIAIIVKGKVMTSTEFNGDMYMPTKQWAGHGRVVINALKRTNDVADYQYEVAKFNKENHHYTDCDHLVHKQPLETLNFYKSYFENWFSDYVYIKNLTNETVQIITNQYDEDGRNDKPLPVNLEPNEIAVLCFGRLELKTK